MNYVLIAIGYLPEYLKFIINTILSIDKNSEIYLFSDTKSDIKNITNININDLNTEILNEFKELNIYKNTIFEDNQLWLTSVLRVFYLENICKLLNIDKFIHFDNDVLIYKPYSELLENFDDTKFNITTASEKNFIFGYSYVSRNSPLKELSKSMLEIALYGVKQEWKFNHGKPYNEMNFLGAVHKKDNNLIHQLPSLPYFTNTPFDPSSYGQFLDGTHLHPKKVLSGKYINLNEPIGIELMSKRIKVKFLEDKPKVFWNKKSFDLANLHIHSKRFNKFLPKEYKNYI
tara:strand:+ start:423 stop:1286 length:864 start_codon:yes stop_codon:yes gene_type:complete